MRLKNPRRQTVSLGVTRLENRTLPASIITVSVGANGTGSLDTFLFDATPGVIATADGGSSPGTLSTGALAAVGATTSISVASTDEITFNDFGGTLTLQTATGRNVAFSTGSGNLLFNGQANNTLATGGGNIAMSAGRILSACNLNTAGGSVSLTAGTSVVGGLFARSIQAGNGNVTLVTNSGTGSSGPITQTGSVSGQNVTINGAGTVLLESVSGTNVSVTSRNNTVSSSGGSPIQSTGQLTLSAAGNISVNTSAASIQATSTAGDISITQAATPARALTTAGTGVRNQAGGRSVTLTNLGDAITVAAGSPVQTVSGAITLAALDINLSGPVNSGTARTTLANSTTGRLVNLGTNTASQIGLTQSELNNVTAAVVRVGSATAGTISVSAGITAPATWNTLALISSGLITENASGTLTVANLAASAPAVGLANANNIGTVAGVVSGSNAGLDNFVLDNNGPLVVGSVDGFTGIATAAGGVFLFADSLDVQQAINAGTGMAQFSVFTSGRPVSLGSEVSGQLSLTEAELARVTAGTLRVGVGTSPGPIAVNGTITRHAGYNTLTLRTGGTVTQTAALSVANLAVRATGAVTLTNASNDVDTLAAQVGGSGNGFSYTDTNSLSVGNADGLVGVSTNAGAVTLTAGGSITDGNGTSTNVTAASLTVNGASSVDLDSDVDTLSITLSGGGAISLTEAGTATVNSLNAVGGSVALDGGTFDLGGNNVIGSGNLAVVGATLNLGAFNQSVTNVVLAGGSIVGTGILSSAAAFDVRSGTVSARLGGNAGLTKTTAGAVTLSGANANTGATTINGGTLLINGSQSGGTVTVNSGGILGGTGSTNAVITVNGGTIAPGTSPGILNTGTLQFTVGATFAVEANSPYMTAGTDYDRVNVVGSVDLNAATLSLVGGAVAPPAGTVLTIINNDGLDPISGTFAGLPQGATVTVGSFAATISYVGGSGNDITLTTVIPADLAVVKTGPSTGIAGNNIVYTITVTNNGPGTAQNVVFTDPLPSSATGGSLNHTSGHPFVTSFTAGSFIATAASMPAGTSATFLASLIVNSNATGTFSNTATVTSSTPDLNGSNNASTSTATVTTSSDLRLTKTGPSTVVAGNPISFTITVTNAGPSDAQVVSLTDAVPANATFVSATQTSGPGFTVTNPPAGGSGTTTLTIATLAAGASATFTIVDQVNAGLAGGATVTNTAAVTANTSDPNTGNNSATVNSTVQVPPVITGHPANQTVGEGSPVTFTASASGVPTPTVQWQVSTNGGGLFIDIPGATSTSLTFNAALGQNGHQFRAVFTNPAGTATGNTATLTVIAKPTAFALTLDVPRDTPRPLTLSGFDPNGRPLTFTVTAPPQHGTLSGTAPNLTYTPAAGYVGPDSLQYKANNGFADSNIALVSVNVFIPGSVQSVVIDNDLGQRSMVRSLTVRFSGVVSFVGAAPSAFQLARTGPGAPAGNVTLAVDLTGSTATQTIARLTFSGPLTEGPNSLIDGNYTLTVFSAQVQGGLPGGDHVTALHRYYGDVNGDRAVNGLDLGLFRGAFGTSLGNPNYLDFLDQNGDGAINGLDLAVFRTHFGTTLP